jgi:hypothetical protein
MRLRSQARSRAGVHYHQGGCDCGAFQAGTYLRQVAEAHSVVLVRGDRLDGTTASGWHTSRDNLIGAPSAITWITDGLILLNPMAPLTSIGLSLPENIKLATVSWSNTQTSSSRLHGALDECSVLLVNVCVGFRRGYAETRKAEEQRPTGTPSRRGADRR